MKVCVTGGSGFIGHWLCRALKDRGYWVRAVDYQPCEYDCPADEHDWQCDLRDFGNAMRAVNGVDEVWALAADMGGMGFIAYHHYDVLHNNALINLNTAEAVRLSGSVKRVLYTSSACVYPARLQTSTVARNLNEDDAWDGVPDTAYGIEKLTSEALYQVLAQDAGVQVRIARFHNIMGSEGSWRGGREKAPAWLCRIAAEYKFGLRRDFVLHGNGEQTRSFCYIDDCLELLTRLMASDYEYPLNIGTDRAVSINELARMVMRVACIDAPITYDVSGPIGVQGRNADLTRMKHVLGWEPQVTLEDGIARTYVWIYHQVKDALERGEWRDGRWAK